LSAYALQTIGHKFNTKSCGFTYVFRKVYVTLNYFGQVLRTYIGRV
jgi:hypothetical protein